MSKFQTLNFVKKVYDAELNEVWTEVSFILWYIGLMDPEDPSELNEKKLETKSSTNPFKIEWSLFWDGLLGDRDRDPEPEPLKALTRDQIDKLIKDLSAQRKILHKQIESVNKEIELNNAKLENLMLVGGEAEKMILHLNQLSDKGQELDSELTTLNQKLKWVRSHEKEIAHKDWA